MQKALSFLFFLISVSFSAQTRLPTVYQNPDTYAEFPGGDAELSNFINTNLKYPPFKLDSGMMAIIEVDFIVDKDGKLYNMHVTEPVKWHPEFSKAAMEVMKKMPNWEPGKHGAVAVATNAHVQFDFSPPDSLVNKMEAVSPVAKKEETVVSGTPPGNPDDGKVAAYVEQQPSFPGGETALMQYLKNNIQYPAIEKDNGIQGTIALTFIVSKDGTIRDIKVLRTIKDGPNLEKEAVRIVKQMPKWIPGKSYGAPVNVQYNLPISFVLRK